MLLSAKMWNFDKETLVNRQKLSVRWRITVLFVKTMQTSQCWQYRQDQRWRTYSLHSQFSLPIWKVRNTSIKIFQSVLMCSNWYYWLHVSGTPYGLNYDIYENYYDYELSDNNVDIDNPVSLPHFITQPLNMVSYKTLQIVHLNYKEIFFNIWTVFAENLLCSKSKDWHIFTCSKPSQVLQKVAFFQPGFTPRIMYIGW